MLLLLLLRHRRRRLLCRVLLRVRCMLLHVLLLEQPLLLQQHVLLMLLLLLEAMWLAANRNEARPWKAAYRVPAVDWQVLPAADSSGSSTSLRHQAARKGHSQRG